MLKDQKNSRIQGNVGLGVAISYFCICGYNVSIPLTDSQDYDLIVEIDNILSRVQVKTTYSKTPYGIFTATLKTSGGNKSGYNIKNFNPDNVNYLFILTEDNDQYFIPCNPNIPKTSINLDKKYNKFKVN